MGSAQAALIAQWMLVGFVHGVMNTDNMTISGETIDYGPCAFMEAYDPETVFSSIDSWGRYAYGNQPSIAGWNLARFAETLLPLIADDQDRAVALAQESLGGFGAQIQAALATGMRAKLGLADECRRAGGDAVDERRCSRCLRPATSTSPRFSVISAGPPAATPNRRAACSSTSRASTTGSARWRALSPDAEVMDRVNPVYIPRNHLVEEALAAATEGDLQPLDRLLDAVTAPYDERPGLERYAEPAPEDFGRYRTFCGT